MDQTKKKREITIELDNVLVNSPIVESEPIEQKQTQAVDIEAPVLETIQAPTPKKKAGLGMKAKQGISNTVIYIILTIMTVIWLFPFVALLLQSLDVSTKGMTGNVIPVKWGIDNYIALFTDTEKNFKRWFLNTTIMGIAVAVLQTIFVLSMSYVLSRMRFKGRKTLMNVMLILGMFPGFLTMILLYKLLSGWGMTGENSIFGLILVYVASSGMGYYVSKGFFDTIPKSLDEAARIDGATRAQVFVKIILPMAKPIVIYTILMGFMAPWGDFVFASYIAHGVDTGKNVAVGLKTMIDDTALGTHYRQFCAGGVVVAIPITLLFLFLQKYYVEGVTGGAVKG